MTRSRFARGVSALVVVGTLSALAGTGCDGVSARPGRATGGGTSAAPSTPPQSQTLTVTLSGTAVQSPQAARRRFERQLSGIEAGDPMTEAQAFDTTGTALSGEKELLIRATRSSRRELARVRFSGGELPQLPLVLNLLEMEEPLGVVIKDVGGSDPEEDQLHLPPLKRRSPTHMRAKFVMDGAAMGAASLRERDAEGVERGLQTDVSTRFPRNADGAQDATDTVARASVLDPDDLSKRRFSAFDTDLDGNFGESDADQLTDADGVPLTDADGAPVIEPVKILEDLEGDTGGAERFVAGLELVLLPDTVVGNGIDTTTVGVRVKPTALGVPFGAPIAFTAEAGTFLSNGQAQVLRTVTLEGTGSEFTAEGDIILLETLRVPQSDEDDTLVVTVAVPGTDIEAEATLTLKRNPAPQLEQVATLTGELSAPVGSTVKLFGRNFAPVAALNTVTFGGAPAVVTAAEESALTVRVPRDGATGLLTVTVDGLTAETEETFEVLPGVATDGLAPKDGATDVSVNTYVSVTFTGEIAALDTTDFTVTDAAGAEVLGIVDMGDDGKSATFAPLSALTENTVYAVSLPDQGFTSTFTTGAAPDETAPTVASVSPADQAAGVGLRSTVRATFSEPIARPSVRADGFAVSADGLRIAGTFGFADGDRTVVFTPTSTTVIASSSLPAIPNLLGGTTYTVTLSEDLTDASGNGLDEPFTFTFTTRTGIGEFSTRAATAGASIILYGGVFSTTAADNVVTFTTVEAEQPGVSGSTEALQGDWTLTQQAHDGTTLSTATFTIAGTKILRFQEPSLTSSGERAVFQELRAWDAADGELTLAFTYETADGERYTEVYDGAVSGTGAAGSWSDDQDEGSWAATVAPATVAAPVFTPRSAAGTVTAATAYTLTVTVPEGLTTATEKVVATQVGISISGGEGNTRPFTVTSRHAPMFTQTAVGVTPAQLALAPDGTRLLVSAQDADLLVELDAGTGAKTGRTIRTGAVPTDIVYSPDGTTAFAPIFGSEASPSTRVAVINTQTAAVVTALEAGKRPTRAALNPAGTVLFVSNYSDGTVTALDVGTVAVLGTIASGGGPNGIAISPDGRKGYVCNYFDGTLTIFDAEKYSVHTTVEVGAGPTRVAVSPTGDFALVTNYLGGSVSLVDGLTDRVLETARTVLQGPQATPAAEALATAFNVVSPFRSPLGVVFSANGERAFINNQGSDTVTVLGFAAVTKTVAEEGGAPRATALDVRGWSAALSGLGSAELSGAARAALDAGPRRRLMVIDEETGIATGRAPAGAVITSDGTRLFVVNQIDASVQTIFLRNPLPQITSLSRDSGDVGGALTITGVNFSSTLADHAVFLGPVPATINAAKSTATSLVVTIPDVTGATLNPDFVARGNRLPFPLPISVQVGADAEAVQSTPRFFLVTPKYPVIVGAQPVGGLKNVLSDARIAVHFSEPMNQSTLSQVNSDESSALFGETVNVPANFIVRRVLDATTGETEDVAGTVSFAAGGRKAIFTPAEPLPAGAVIRYAISSAVTDLDSNAVNGFLTTPVDADPTLSGLQVFSATFQVSAVNYDAPRLERVEPRFGPAAGGTAVTLTGRNFTEGMAVFFGPPEAAAQATDVVVVSATQAAAVTPAGKGGPVTVRVRRLLETTVSQTTGGETATTVVRTPLFGELPHGFVYDQGTTVIGKVVDARGVGVAGASVAVLTLTATSGEGGTFSFADVPSAQGDLVVRAEASGLFGFSRAAVPLPGATTDVGNVVITPELLNATAFNTPPVLVADSPRPAAVFGDRDNSGTVTPGDTVALRFDQRVRVNSPDATTAFALPVAGDALGANAVVRPLPPIITSDGDVHYWVQVTLGANPKLTPKGSFSLRALTAGSPSGIDVSASLPRNAIESADTGLDARDLPVPGLDDNGVDLARGKPAQVVRTFYADANRSEAVDSGDVLVVDFDTPVVLGTADANAVFALPVAGDMLGEGARVQPVTLIPGTVYRGVRVVLGFGARLTVAGAYSLTRHFDGAPSGIDVQPGLTTATLSGLLTGLPAAPLDPKTITVEGVSNPTDSQRQAAVATRRDLAGISAPSLASVDAIDDDGSGTVTAGDRLLVSFTAPVRVNATNAAAIFALPVEGDTLGTGAVVRGQNGDSLDSFTGDAEIVLGADPVLTIAGTFSESAVTAGSPSGLAIAETMPKGAIVDLLSGIDVERDTPAEDLVQSFGLTLAWAQLRDTNENGAADQGDVLILTFNGTPDEDALRVRGTPDPAAVFFLPVAGDTLGTGATLTAIPGQPLSLAVTLGAGAKLTLGGSYSSSAREAGAPSGIDISATMPKDAIEGLYDGLDVEDRGATNDNADGAGVDVDFLPGPKLIEARWQDRDSSGTVTAGDTLRLEFTEGIRLAAGGATPAQVFELLVAGDSFGTGATLAVDSDNFESFGHSLLLTLGADPVLTPSSSSSAFFFSFHDTGAGSSSGIDVRADLAADLLESTFTGIDAEAWEVSGSSGGSGIVGIFVQQGEPPRPTLDFTVSPPGPAAVFRDVDGSGTVTQGDFVFVRFDDFIAVRPENLTDVNGDGRADADDLFLVPVTGDTLGAGATVALVPLSGEPFGDRVKITLGANPKLTVEPGVFDPTLTLAGSPSGIDLRSDAPGNVLEDDVSGVDARPSADGPFDLAGPRRPRLDPNVRHLFEDTDENGAPSLGDRIIVTFDQPVIVRNNDAARVFAVPVEGDTLGTGAGCFSASPLAGQPSYQVIIELGVNPVLTLDGEFQPFRRAPGSPSGLDVSPAMPVGAIQTLNVSQPDLSGISAADLGAPGADDAGVDVFFLAGPYIISAELFDEDLSSSATAGDTIWVQFGRQDPISGLAVPVTIAVNHSDANAIFALPVSGDTLGAGAFVERAPQDDSVAIITLGAGPALHPGAFDFCLRRPGDASGIDVAVTMPAHAIQTEDGVDARDLPEQGVDDTGVPILLGEQPEIERVLYVDKNRNHTIDAGDALLIEFNIDELRVGQSSATGVFFLPVAGDSLGANPTMRVVAGPYGDLIEVTLGAGVTLTPAGDFDHRQRQAGRSSGLDIAAAMPDGAITDGFTGARASDDGVPFVDGDGGEDVEYSSLITGVPAPEPPMITDIFLDDRNENGQADAGEALDVIVDQPLKTAAGLTPEQVFALPVAGDSFGAGATFALVGNVAAADSGTGQPGALLRVVLGADPVLTVSGTGGFFDRTQRTAGSPSGLDFAAALPADAVQSLASGVDAEDRVPSSFDLATGEQPGDAVSITSVNVDDTGVAITFASAPVLFGASFYDLDGSHGASAGDVLQLSFSNPLRLKAGTLPADLFTLPVTGDSFGAGALIHEAQEGHRPGQSGHFTVTDLHVVLGAGARLTTNGDFAASGAGISGAPSGVAVRQDAAPDLAEDWNTGGDIRGFTPVDVAFVPGPQIPRVEALDLDGDGAASAGDRLRVTFTTSLATGTTLPDPVQLFALPVAGDSFGTGATAARGTSSSIIEITLGAGPVLTVGGFFSDSALTAGSASGLDLRPDLAAGVLKAAFAPQALHFDLRQPLNATDLAPEGDPAGASDIGLLTLAAPRLTAARAIDVDGSNSITPGDVLELTFDRSVTVDPSVEPDVNAIFDLPVSGDTLGSGGSFLVNQGFTLRLQAGTGASFTIPGTFSAANLSAGAPSGIDVRTGLARGALFDTSTGRAAEPSLYRDITVSTASAPRVAGAFLVDLDGDGVASVGDAAEISFTATVNYDLTKLGDHNGDGTVGAPDDLFALPVPGDTFGAGATFQTFTALNQSRLRVLLGANPVLTVPGTFSEGGSAGGPSGIDVRTGATGNGVLVAASGGLSVADLAPAGDGQGADLAPYSAQAPVITRAVYADGDTSGTVNSGDTVTLTFSQGVRINTTSPDGSVFFFGVGGDAFGDGATMSQSFSGSSTVVITLGTAPNLRVAGVYDPQNSGPGAPSGIDIVAPSGGGSPGGWQAHAIESSSTGIDAEDGGVRNDNFNAGAGNDGIDIEEPPGPVIVSASYRDLDGHGVSGGDEIRVLMSGPVNLAGGTGDPAQIFVLGNFNFSQTFGTFGSGATVTEASAASTNSDLIITLGDGASLDPASPLLVSTYIDVSVSMLAGALTDAISGGDVKDLGRNGANDSGLFIQTQVRPTVASVGYIDQNGSGTVDQGDLLRVRFSRAVTVVGTDLAALFVLPVADDSFGTGASIEPPPAGSTGGVIEVLVKLGTGATLTVGGVFTSQAVIAGSPSGLDLNAARPMHSIEDPLTGVDAVDSGALFDNADNNGVDIDLPAGVTAPQIVFVEHRDLDLSGTVNARDAIIVVFNPPARLAAGITDPNAVFVLPVEGDSFGAGAELRGFPEESGSPIVVILGSAPVLEPKGFFSPGVAAPGSPSGVLLSSATPPNAIEDPATGADARPNPDPGFPNDIDEQSFGGEGPMIQSVLWCDDDESDDVTAGDRLIVTFSQPVTLNTTDPARLFALPVAGDALGTGATVRLAPYDANFRRAGTPRPWNFDPEHETDLDDHGYQLIVTLGAGATLAIDEEFTPGVADAGAPSGLDILDTLEPGLLVNAETHAGALPGGGVDIMPNLLHLETAVFVDQDGDGKPSAGDLIALTFEGDVGGFFEVDVLELLHLPVAGDSLGEDAEAVTNAAYFGFGDFGGGGSFGGGSTGGGSTGGPLAGADVIITLGLDPVLTLDGVFDEAALTAGLPSGIDVRAQPDDSGEMLIGLPSEGVLRRRAVRALGDRNQNDSGSDLEVAPSAPADTNPPGGTFLSASPGLDLITLSWSPASDDVSTPDALVYRIYVETAAFTDTTGLTPAATTGPGATSFTVSGLQAGTQYFVAVLASDEAGNQEPLGPDNNTTVTTGQLP